MATPPIPGPWLDAPPRSMPPIAVIGAVPLIGPFLSLLNVALIFRENRRCLHDDFADTAVVIA